MGARLRRAGAAALAATLAACGGGGDGSSEPTMPACIAEPGVPALAKQRVAAGLDRPIDLQSSPGDRRRVYVAEQSGKIKVIRDGLLQPTPFIDLGPRVLLLSSEQGLLGFAFHPQFASNGRFFVNYINPQGNTHVSEFRAHDADRGDPESERVILVVPQPFSAHNGGGLAFGGDGRLYASLGDGGGGEDEFEHGQRLDVLLAKMLRLDVDGTPPYAIPPDNPFVGRPGTRGEIWSYGLRNPWRFAFDRFNNDLFIADVGASQREEVNVAPRGRGGDNFGWRVTEGSACFRPVSACSSAGHTLPVHEYGRAVGCAIIGGAVYRGCRMPGLHGHYFYSDYCTAFLRSFRYEGGQAVDHRDWTAEAGGVLDRPTAFGTDADGELYVLQFNGDVFKIVPHPR